MKRPRLTKGPGGQANLHTAWPSIYITSCLAVNIMLTVSLLLLNNIRKDQSSRLKTRLTSCYCVNELPVFV